MFHGLRKKDILPRYSQKKMSKIIKKYKYLYYPFTIRMCEATPPAVFGNMNSAFFVNDIKVWTRVVVAEIILNAPQIESAIVVRLG
jgi:hypothetical protein